MSAHSKYSPSKSKRWINCPASIKRSELVPSLPTSKYAALGTAVHKLGEYCLTNETFPDLYYGKSIDGFEVDDEMVSSIELYIDTIYDDIEKIKGEYETGVECYVNMEHIHPDLGGTCDFELSTKTKLSMYDYKNGRGEVDAEENTQGMNYLLGRATQSSRKWKEYEFVIVQPRLDNPDARVKRWSCTHKELMKFQKIVLDAIQDAESDEPTLCAGDWCHFCPDVMCPALHNKSLSVASKDFTPVSEELNFTDPKDLPMDRLLLVLNNANEIESWLKKVRGYAFTLLKEEIEVGDYKLVRGRANRKWKDPIKAIKQLQKLGYEDEDILSEPKLKTVKQIEGVVEDKKEIKKLWEKPEGKITITGGDDKREAVTINAASDFDVFEED